MNHIDAIMLDLDGTLLQTDKTVSDFTVSVLNECKKAGIKIAVVTARGPETCYELFRACALHFDAYILNGGAEIAADGTSCIKHFLPAANIKEIYAKLLQKSNNPLVYCSVNQKMYTNISPAVFPGYIKDYMVTGYNFSQCDFAAPRLNILFNKQQSSLTPADVQDCLPNGTAMVLSDGGMFAMITQRDAEKAKAIKFLCSLWNIPASNTVSFGDDFMDIEMIRVCGTGVAMKNAIDEVKSAADCVTKQDNDNDGVAAFIVEHILCQ